MRKAVQFQLSIKALADGRIDAFLEIGKTDIYQNRMLGLRPFKENLSYHATGMDSKPTGSTGCCRIIPRRGFGSRSTTGWWPKG